MLAEEQIFEFKPARINERFLAYLLDLAPFLGGYALCFYRFRSLPHRPGLGTRLILIFMGAYFAYEFIGNLLGATAGKWLMGIRVVGTDGRSLGLARSLIRAAGYFLSTPFFNFGFIIALFQPQSRALHDLLAKTAVVDVRSKNPTDVALIFVGAMALLSLVYGGFLYLSTVAPVAAVAQAQQALAVLGQIEETYKASHGTYTADLRALANASGNLSAFRDSLSTIFEPDDFVIEADASHYRIEARLRGYSSAKPIVIEGPASPPSR